MFMSAVYLIKRRFLSALSQGDRNDKAILTCLHSTYISTYDQIECDLSPYCRSLCQLIYRTVHMFCPFFLVNLSFISHHLSVPGFTLLPVPHCAVSRWCGISSFIIQWLITILSLERKEMHIKILNMERKEEKKLWPYNKYSTSKW